MVLKVPERLCYVHGGAVTNGYFRLAIMTPKLKPQSVEGQAKALALLCGMPGPWLDVHVLVLGQRKVKIEEVVYDLQKVAIHGTVILRCDRCHRTPAWGSPVIRAKLRKRRFLQNATGEVLGQWKSEYVSKLWCLNCSKQTAAEHNGSLEFFHRF